MKRDEIRAVAHALKALDRADGHQPLADLLAKWFPLRPAPPRRCACGSPLDGWMMSGNQQVIWCRICNTTEEAMAYLSDLTGPPPKRPREWRFSRRSIAVDWGTYVEEYRNHKRVLNLRLGNVTLALGWLGDD